MTKFINLLFIFLITLPAYPAKALEGLARFPESNNTTVFLEVASTSEEKSRGLMNRDSLDANRGMVFVFRPARQVTFWMKDTLIPLDMIFIRDGKIMKIEKNTLINQTEIVYPSGTEVTEVIEVNAGYTDKHDIEVGNTVIFENIAEIDYSKQSKLEIIKRK